MKMDRMKKRQRSNNTQPSRPVYKKSRQASPPAFSSTFTSSNSLIPFNWTPQPVHRSVASSILLQEMMTEMREQRKILETLATQQQELIKDVKTIMTTMGLDDSKPEMMDDEYNYYA